MLLTPGTRLGRYEIIAPLGAGGMGEVHLARDERLDRRVAVKALPAHLVADPIARERLRREAVASASLDHPFICKVFEVGESGDASYIVMEYVEGQTLHERLATGALPFGECVRIAGEIADALEAAHAGRLVHRDLKPANVMLTPQGHVKVMDFGLARQVTAHNAETVADSAGRMLPLTEIGTRVGTPDYMSPEQALGESVDDRSDLFSFGILLAELLTGTHPFRRLTAEATLAAIIRDPPVISSAGRPIPPAMTIIIRRLLAKLPADRYPSITDVRRDLAALSASGMASVAADVTVAGRGSTRFPLIGRDSERAALLAGLDEAVAGRGSFVMIAGEPGIGKTRLTAEILAEARKRGIFCLAGHCYEMEGAPPYVPFVEMLEYSARHLPPADFRQALGDAASGVSKLMPELRSMFPDIPDPPPLPPEQQRRFLFNAYLAFVERSCRVAPIAVVLEDLHWADEPTLMLMQHLVAAHRSMPLFTIGTYRDVELGVTRPFARTLETLLRERRITRIVLRRLPVEGVESMLASLSGHPPPPSLARVIFDDTEGNPFFVEEVFQHLAEEDKLFDENGIWRKDLKVRSLEVPEGVRLVIGRRLQRLPEAARAVLTTGAIIGRVFSLRVLEAIERSGDADVVLDAIEEAERAQLLVAEPSGREARYRFAHELIRQTLVETVSLPRRQRQHARIAEAMERVYSASLEKHASALAHHLYQAGAAADSEKATKYLMTAAAQARAAAGFEEALAHLDHALSLWEGERNASVAAVLVERAGVLFSLARTSEGMVALQQAVDLYDQLGDAAMMVLASVRLAGALVWHARHGEVGPVTSRALVRLGATPAPALRCRLLIYNALADIGSGQEPQRALDTMAEVLSLQRTIDDPGLEQECVSMDSHVHYEAMHFAQAATLALRAGALARAQDNLWGAANVEWMAAATELHQGRLQEGIRAFTSVMADAERTGHLPVIWVCRTFLASARMIAGDLEGARHTAEESRAFAQAIGTPWLFIDDLLIGVLEHRLGRRDESIARVRAALAAELQTFWSGISRAYLFYLLAFNGDAAAATVLEEAPPHVPIPGLAATLGSWLSLPPLARGLAHLGRRDEVAALHPAMEALVQSELVVHYTLIRTDAGIAAAAAGEWALADQHHRAAMSQAEALGSRVFAAESREWYATMLRARDEPGDRERGRALLTEAVALYESLGMTIFSERARARLSAGWKLGA
jgi:tetratricopeptide (TPR) repeat protein